MPRARTMQDVLLGPTAWTGWKFHNHINIQRFIREHGMALTRACVIAESMEDAWREIWYWMLWPHGNCLNTCLLLAPCIRMPLELDVRINVGVVLDGQPHAWLQTPNGDIIDPTFGMFDNGPHLRVLTSRESGLLGHWPEITLSLDEEEYFRRAITPISGDQSWRPGSGVIEELFSDHPHRRVRPWQ